MRALQIVIEFLLLAVFAAARPVFVLQALAFGAAVVAGVLASGGAFPDWLLRALVSTAIVSATLGITGLLLSKARRWEHASQDEHDVATWPMPFGVTLVLIVGLAVYAALPLTALWREILERLDGNVDWGGLSRPAPNAGLILLPILVGLMIPALVTLAAVAATVLPLALLALLPNRRPRFMALVGMSAFTQAGMAAASWLSARTLAGLVDVAAASMRESGDGEVVQVADWLIQASATLDGTAVRLLAPAVGLVAWLVFLQPWQADQGENPAVSADP